MPAFSAKQARVQINGTNVLANKWSCKIKVDELDITNFETSGYADYIGGVIEAEVDCDIQWNSSAHPTSNPPNLVAGATITNLKLYLDLANLHGAFFLFPSFLILDCSAEAEARGILRFTFRGKNKGTFSYPS